MAATTFPQQVYRLVAFIPPGKVMTYGQIALLLGAPRAARAVGWALYLVAPEIAAKIPWQRVINSKGGISTIKLGWGEIQKGLLEKEGVKVSRDFTVELSQYQWWPSEKICRKLAVPMEIQFLIENRLSPYQPTLSVVKLS